MLQIESAAVIRPLRGKDHDRVFISEDNDIFAVFDGAGNRFASDLALSTLRSIVEDKDEFNVVNAMTKIQNDLLKEFSGGYLTTGSIIHLFESESDIVCDFACAGDSPIFSYSHGEELFERLTINESQRIDNYIEASNFLGNKLHSLKQVGRLVLKSDTSFLIVSDGIVDEYYEGHLKDEDLELALKRKYQARQLARQIISQTEIFDDATVVAVRVLDI